jgi:IS5 family transposase
LALVAGQDVEPGDDEGTWRIAQRVAPDRVISTVDPESRHMHKSRSVYRDGYKAHVAVEPDTGLITATALTPANAGDGPSGVELLAGEEPGLQVLADSAYGSGAVRVALDAAATPPRSRRSRWAATPSSARTSSTATTSSIDHTAGTVTCPGWSHRSPSQPRAGRPSAPAAVAARCDRDAPPQSMAAPSHIHPHDADLVAARAAWGNGDFAADYRQHRPMVERSIAWLVAKNNRRVRYRGVERNQHGLATRVAAINLRRLVNLGLDHGPNGWTMA